MHRMLEMLGMLGIPVMLKAAEHWTMAEGNKDWTASLGLVLLPSHCIRQVPRRPDCAASLAKFGRLGAIGRNSSWWPREALSTPHIGLLESMSVVCQSERDRKGKDMYTAMENTISFILGMQCCTAGKARRSATFDSNASRYPTWFDEPLGFADPLLLKPRLARIGWLQRGHAKPLQIWLLGSTGAPKKPDFWSMRTV